MGKSVLCAISHGLYDPWIAILHDGQELTWLTSPRPQGFEVVHFHGTPVSKMWKNVDKIHERIRWSTRKKAALLKILDFFLTLPLMEYDATYSKSELLSTRDLSVHTHFPDTYLTYRWKELAFFKYFIQETDCEYLFLTSTSSYVRPSKLMEFIQSLPSTKVYAGALPYKDANFVSGSNRILSRDVVEAVLAKSKSFNPTIIEDVALGRVILGMGITPILHPLFNIADMGELLNTSDNDLMESYHFRLKSGALDNRGDIEIMIALHERILELEVRNVG